MKKTVTWNGLIAMAAVVAMSVFVFGCTDQEATTVEGAAGALALKGTIKGQVVDINNNPVEGATAILLNKKVKTNAAGEYVFRNVPVSGQLGCEADCDENPYLIFVQSPTVRVENVEVPLFADAYTAAFLSFTSLQAIAADTRETDLSGNWQAVAKMGVTAIPAVMRRMNATVNGFVIETATGLPIAGALVTLNPSRDAGPPNAWDIWRDEESSWAIGDPTTVTDASGLFSFSGVPEGSDSRPVYYTVTVTAPGFVICPEYYSDNYPTVQVGTGGHTYWVDAGSWYFGGNTWWNQADPILLCPGLPPVDRINPWVTATNLPPTVIVDAQLGGPFTWTFNEALNIDRGRAIIRIGNGAPLDTDQIWDVETNPAAPVLTVTPLNPLPRGLTIRFELVDIADVAGNRYQGYTPGGNNDAFTSLGSYATQTARLFRTAGDPDLMVASNVAQDAAVASPTQPIGGKSGNVPQANNLNFLDWDGELGIGVTKTTPPLDDYLIGDRDGEANWISLSWDPATTVDPEATGTVSYYRVYAELGTGGFTVGVPVYVAQTAFSWVDPVTTWTGTLTQVNTAMVNWNNTRPSGDPAVPTIAGVNGTTWYFDNGFAVNMAVTAVNNDGREGPYSNVAAVRDVVPPTVADQGYGFDATVPTGWPVLPITVDLDDLDEIGGTPGDGLYNAADYAAFAAAAGDVAVLMSEDLDPTDASAVLVALGGGGATLNSINVTRPQASVLGLPEVTLVLNGIAHIQQNDHVIIDVLDEAGNSSEAADSVVHFYDGIPALIAEGVVVAGEAGAEVMTLTFSEPVNETEAETIGNYNLNGTDLAAPYTVELDEGGTVVTIDAPAGFGVTDSVYVVVADVPDLIGNTPSTLGFQVEDQIAPVILSAYHPGPVAINSAPPGDDGIWSVGDTPAAAPPDFNIVADISEEIDIEAGISVVYSGGATCTAGALVVTPSQIAFPVTCTAGTVAQGDRITITAQDLSGNPLSPAIILNAALSGTNIDPLIPPPPPPE